MSLVRHFHNVVKKSMEYKIYQQNNIDIILILKFLTNKIFIC